MLPIFESLLPVFLLIATGYFLKKINLLTPEQWSGLERAGFYVFFPCLLFTILSKTDFYALPSGAIVFSLLTSLAIILVLGIAILVPVQKLFGLSRSSYSSIYQGFGRWNAFIALAVVEKLLDPAGLAIVAIVIATVAIPTVFVNVSVVGWLGDRNGDNSKLFRMIVYNPLIIGALIGLIVSLARIPIYGPVAQSLEMAGRVTLPLGLILVGYGLILKMPRRMFAASVFGTFMKLVFVPFVYLGVGYLFGLRGETLVVLGICGSVPSAMNGYLIAKEMGGDAPLYASIVTLQTITAFFTMPIAILIATYFAG